MTTRWNVFGRPVFGDVEIVRLLKRLDESELGHLFEIARDQGEVTVELKGQRYRLTRNQDYTFVIAPDTSDHQLISH